MVAVTAAGGAAAAWMRGALTLALAAAAALLCERLRVPLAWTLGPLLATALACSAGARLRLAPQLRHGGQWVIGTALGLHFTPEVLRQLPGLAPALLAGVLWALLMGAAFSRLLLRSGAPDRATAFFAGAIGGASEMAVLAERHGGRVDRVAAAHSLRVLIVVVAVPWGLQAAGFHPLEARAAGAEVLPGPLLGGLCAATLAGALVMRRLGSPNPWVLGALLAGLALVGTGTLPGGMLPQPMTNAGQLLIGVSLGTRFTPAFLHAAPRWLAAVALGTLGMLAASTGFAWVLAWAMSLAPAVVLLGNSPGGMAEMCITAQVLQLGVPLVTAFHVVRYVAVLVLMNPLYRWQERRLRRRQALESLPLA